MAKRLSDKFDFKLIEEFPGYNSSGDKTKLAPGTLIRGSKNIYKKLSGTLATRPGVKRRGSADSTNAGVKSEFVWETNVGTTRPLRVCNGKLQVESDIVTPGTYVWYDLLETSTLAHPAATLTRFVFDTWWDNDEVADRLLAVRGDDKILSWSGGMALVSSVTAASLAGAVVSISLNAGGSGYATGNLLTISGGGGTGATVRVTASVSGTVTAVNLVTSGSGYTAGSGLAVTGGGGTGVTLDISIATVGTITKVGTETWSEVGFTQVLSTEKKIIINGTEYSYTAGEGTTTLTGVSPDPAGITANSVVIQSIISNSASDVSGYDFDFCKTINNQFWVGSYSSRVVYLSADINAESILGFLNFVDTTTHLQGDGSSIVLDNQVKGIGIKDGKGIVFAGDSDMYIVSANEIAPTPFNNPDGDSQVVYNKIERKKLPGLCGALGHEFIDNFNDQLVWLDQKNQLRALGSFTNESFIKPAHLSLAVKDELSEDDFTGGHIKVVEDTIYITAPNNGRDWMYQVREVINKDGSISSEKIWQPPQIRGISRYSVINGVLYGHSNANPQLYQIWDTNQWYDDHPSDEQIPYVCVWRFAYQQHGHRQGLLTFDKIYFEGYMPEGVELLSNIYFDYKGATNLKQVVVNSVENPAQFFIGTGAPSLGDSSLGDNPLGDGIIEETNDQELLPKFRAITGVSLSRKFFEYSIELYTAEEGSRVELLCLGTNARLATQQPTFLQK